MTTLDEIRTTNYGLLKAIGLSHTSKDGVSNDARSIGDYIVSFMLGSLIMELWISKRRLIWAASVKSCSLSRESVVYIFQNSVIIGPATLGANFLSKI